MKKIKLPNGSVVYSMSEQEETAIKNRINSFQELRRDTIPDLIYKTKPSVFGLYKTDDGKLIFDYGQVRYLVLPHENVYNYYLDKEKLYQTIHSLDFITQDHCKEFISEVDKLTELFCKRNQLEKKDLTLNKLRNDILNKGTKSSSFLPEQVAVMCFLQSKAGFSLECFQAFNSDRLCSLTMVDKVGKRISPSQLVAKIYETNK